MDKSDDESILESDEAIHLIDSFKFQVHYGCIFYHLGELDQAVRLIDSSQFHQQLGYAFCQRGEYDKAIQEFKKALSLNSNNIILYRDIAWAYLLLGKFDESIKETKKYLNAESESKTYLTLYQYLALKEIGENNNAQRLLESYVKDFRGKAWEDNLLQYHLNRIGEAELFSRTENNCGRCVAFFYIGYDYFLKGDKQKAAEYFQKAVDTKAYGFVEYGGAKVMLQRLKK